MQPAVRSSGYTFIEVMVAMVVLAIGLVGLAGITNIIIFQNMFASDYQAATRLAYDRLNELLRYDAESDIASDVSSDHSCNLTGRCNALPQGLMLAPSPGDVRVDDAAGVVKIRLDNSSVSDTERAEIEDTATTAAECSGISNADKLEAGANSDFYCARTEPNINAESNFKPQSKGGYGKNSFTFQPPYKYNRFYSVCECYRGVPEPGTPSEYVTGCTSVCTNFNNTSSSKITMVVKVYVYWADNRGTYHTVSTPYQGIEIEVDQTSDWCD